MATNDARLEHALSQWSQWRPQPKVKPQVEKPLSKGQSHSSWLVAVDQLRYVVKLNNPTSRLLAQPIEQEVYCQELAASMGVAPQIIYVGADYFVSEFIDADLAFVNSDLPANASFELGRALHQVHGVADQHLATLPEFDMARHIDDYWEKLNSVTGSGLQLDGLRRHQQPMCELVAMASKLPQQKVLCHHDLNPNNILFLDKKAVIIDWEYAALNHPYFDLATIVHYLSATAYQDFLKGYGLARVDAEMLGLFGCIVNYMEALWWAIVDKESQAFIDSLKRLDENLKRLDENA